MCFGVNPDTRVHPGILIPGDCWVSTLPAASVDAAADTFLNRSLQEVGQPPWKHGLFHLGKKKKKKIQVEDLLAIFSAKSKMDDLCPLWPEVRCQGSVLAG